MAKLHPYQEAVIFPNGRDSHGRLQSSLLTYSQLDELSERAARGLVRLGIGPGVRCAFLVKPSLEFFVMTFALFKAGAVPVLIDPGIGIRNMKRCLAEADVQAFIGIPAAHIARLLFRWRGQGPWTRTIVIGRRRFFGSPSYEDLLKLGEQDLPLPESHEPAAILFTSGSTGAPKGAVYSHANFLAQVDLLRESLNIGAGERDLCTFPLFALFAPALGMTAVVPEMDFTRPARVDPWKIKEAIETFGIRNMFGSPALIRRVAAYGVERSWTFPSLKRVISAGAPVPASVMMQFKRMLPSDAQFFTPYGATETLPVAVAESGLLETTRLATENGQGVCIGKPVPGTKVRILRVSDQSFASFASKDLLGAFAIGEIIVSGPQVTERYYQRAEANALGKIRDSEGRLYHRMGDLGYFDGEGRLWFCGRKNHRVQSAKGDLYTIPCEAVFNQHPLVARTALVGLGEAPFQRPCLCVEAKGPLSPADKARLFADLRATAQSHPHTESIQTFVLHRDFPVDIRHNAKIFREKLKLWAEKKYS